MTGKHLWSQTGLRFSSSGCSGSGVSYGALKGNCSANSGFCLKLLSWHVIIWRLVHIRYLHSFGQQREVRKWLRRLWNNLFSCSHLKQLKVSYTEGFGYQRGTLMELSLSKASLQALLTSTRCIRVFEPWMQGWTKHKTIYSDVEKIP